MKHTSPSQTKAILTYLLVGHTLTPLSALRMFGCFRLGARIYELKKRGWGIQTRMVERKGKRVAEYSLTAY